MSEQTPLPWYLLQIKPNGLTRAEANLARQGVRCFMPRHRLPSRGPTPGRRAPLFPGYLFAAFDPQRIAFRTVNATYGVARLVTGGYDLSRGLPPGLVEGLRARCDPEGMLLPPARLKPNEKVRILSGPFAGFIAVVETLPSAERVRVLFEMMGREIRAELPRSGLEHALGA